MNLLITGAFKASEEQLNILKSLDFNMFFLQDERGDIPVDFYSADAVVCNGLFLYHNIEDFKDLKFIQLTSAGLDRVPLDYIQKNGIEIHNARGVYSIPMAEFAISGVLSLYKHLDVFYENQKRHLWQKDRALRELMGDTVLIIGCGSVGTECAKRFKAFDMTVLAADIRPPKSLFYDRYYPMQQLTEALEKADVIVLTLPLTDSTRGLFGRNLFACCKQHAILVNLARGAVVCEADLISALQSERLGGAVLDVFETEPLPQDSPLWEMQNVHITPHNSFVSQKNNGRLFELAYTNLQNFMRKDVKK